MRSRDRTQRQLKDSNLSGPVLKRVRLKCGSGYGTERNGTDMGLKCGTERNGYGVKTRNGTERIWG